MTRLWIIFLAVVAMATASSFFASSPGKARAFSRVPMPDRAFVSGPKVPQTARLADSENAVQGLHARNKEALSTEPKITQGISPVLKQFPKARAGLPSLQPTAVAQTGLLSRLKIDFLAITQPAKLAGRLAHFVQNWRLISSDPDVLVAVVGYKLEFTSTPFQTGLPPVLHFSKSDSAKIDTEIQSLQQP